VDGGHARHEAGGSVTFRPQRSESTRRAGANDNTNTNSSARLRTTRRVPLSRSIRVTMCWRTACLSLGGRFSCCQMERPHWSLNSAGLLPVRFGLNPHGCPLLDRGPDLPRPLAPLHPRLSQPLEPRLVAIAFRHGDLVRQDSECAGTPMIEAARRGVCALWHTRCIIRDGRGSRDRRSRPPPGGRSGRNEVSQ
jgi:hypothetical protein